MSMTSLAEHYPFWVPLAMIILNLVAFAALALASQPRGRQGSNDKLIVRQLEEGLYVSVRIPFTSWRRLRLFRCLKF